MKAIGRHSPEMKSKRPLLIWAVGTPVVVAILVLGGILWLQRSQTEQRPAKQVIDMQTTHEKTTSSPTNSSPDSSMPPAATSTTDTSNTTGTTAPAIGEPWQATSAVRGRPGVEAAAIELAQRYRLVPLVGGTGEDDRELCPADRLRVLWSPPDGTYEIGAYIPPLGPPPDESTTTVNGVVDCEGSKYAYTGFEATWDAPNGLWTVVPTPSGD